eukprot:1759117-Amphidinium_carterae.1
MGVAIVSFQNPYVCAWIAQQSRTVVVDQVTAEVKTHVDPKTGEDPFALFVAWGRTAEKEHHVSARSLASHFDDLHEQALVALETLAAVSLHEFIKSKGGQMPVSDVTDFFREHPEHKALLDGRLKQVCASHSLMLHFMRSIPHGVVIKAVSDDGDAMSEGSKDLQGTISLVNH